MARLKVFRTPIGFHDAYVAAPSQKAALQAWGSDVDLFARGVADVVTDEQLVAEPLANPGKVIRRLGGTVDEQLAAAKMPDQPAPRARRDEDDAAVRPKRSAPGRRATPATKPSSPSPPPPPRKPDRGALDAAEKALGDCPA